MASSKKTVVTLQQLPAEILSMIAHEVFCNAVIELASPLALTDSKKLALTDSGANALFVYELFESLPLEQLL